MAGTISLVGVSALLVVAVAADVRIAVEVDEACGVALCAVNICWHALIIITNARARREKMNRRRYIAWFSSEVGKFAFGIMEKQQKHSKGHSYQHIARLDQDDNSYQQDYRRTALTPRKRKLLALRCSLQ